MTGISRSFNPAISANALFDAVYADDATHDDADGEAGQGHGHGASDATGLRVQEVELQLSAVVDAYLKADLLLAFPGGEGVELEEGFVTAQSLPGGMQMKAGRFLAAMGHHNTLHAHQYPFLNAPLANEHVLGDEGLTEDGVALSWLSPLPWFLELTGQILDGRSDLFDSPEGEELLYLGHARSFWDVGENWTLDLGGSYATGANSQGKTSALLGTLGTIQWRDLDGWGRRLIWRGEYLRADHGQIDGGEEQEGGGYTSLEAQIARRWWLQGRYDRMGMPGDENDWRTSFLVGFIPSEFSALRLQFDRRAESGETSNVVSLQMNVTMGSHPAHRY
ncbi:MAG: hypothetical protein CME04_15300 [Gemmatimonadaceae bacterium]|nr:hypothetical protein [Gemmatimonadaceae bacterium]